MFRAVTALSVGEQIDKSMPIFFVWGSRKQLWIILVIPHCCSEFFSPTCSVNKPYHGATSAASPNSPLLGHLQVPTHETPHISPDKLLSACRLVCVSLKKAMLWDPAVHPGCKAPKHIFISLAHAEVPGRATLFKHLPEHSKVFCLLSRDRSKSAVEHSSAVEDQI